MRIVTYASNRNHRGLNEYLLPSCEYHGLKLDILCTNTSFFGSKWTNQTKDRLLAEYLESVDDNEIIFSTDAYDAWFLEGENEILRKFHSFDHPLVFSAERNCWPPDKEMCGRYPVSPTTARYLNSGGFIGMAGAIRDALKRVTRMFPAWKKRKSNQYRWSNLFLNNPGTMVLDTACRIFYCAAIPGSELRSSPWGTDFKKLLSEHRYREYITERILNEIRLEGTRVRYKQTDNRPSHFHLNGPTAVTMDLPVWRSLMPWLEK